MRTGELYECVESPFSYSRSWGYTSSRILLYDGWLRQRLLTEILLLAIYSALHRLSRSVNLEYYDFLVFSNYLIVTTPLCNSKILPMLYEKSKINLKSLKKT